MSTKKQTPYSQGWGVGVFSDSEEEEEEEEEKEEEDPSEAELLRKEAEQLLATKNEVQHKPLPKIFHRNKTQTACGAPKETVHFAPSAAFVRDGNTNRFVDKNIYNSFQKSDVGVIQSSIPPFAAPMDQDQMMKMLRWENDMLRKQKELENDPYYNFAQQVAQMSNISDVKKLWRTPEILPPAWGHPRGAPAWTRDLLEEPEAESFANSSLFRPQTTTTIPEGRKGKKSKEEELEEADTDEEIEEGREEGSMTPLFRTSPTPFSRRFSSETRLPFSTGGTGEARRFTSAGAPITTLTRGVRDLTASGIPIPRGVSDAIMQRMEDEALQLSKRDRDARLVYADSRNWIETPMVTGVAHFTTELKSAATSAYNHLKNNVYHVSPGLYPSGLGRRNTNNRRMPSMDFFIKNPDYRYFFADLTSTFVVEPFFSNPKTWQRKELPFINGRKRAIATEWFKKNAYPSKYPPATPDSGIWLSERMDADISPEDVVNWIGSGYNPPAKGILQSSKIANLHLLDIF